MKSQMDLQQLTAPEAMAIAKSIRKTYNLGGIDFDKAVAEAQPYLDIVNVKGLEIAQKHKRFYRKITFMGLGR